MKQFDEPNNLLDIATGLSASSASWKNVSITWDELVKRLKAVQRTSETYREYVSAKKTEQSKIKDIGGFVGGFLNGGKRNSRSVLHRSVITLDIDFALESFWEEFIMQYDCAAVLHSTHKHSPMSPRYRLIMPLNRTVTPDEYQAISRKIAGNIGIELFDNTTFQPERLMFWSSVSKDGEFVFESQEGLPVDADEILNQYVNWTDVSSWATSEATFAGILDSTKKQQDPLEKRGLIGVFCRTYTIREAIEKFIPEVYVEGLDGRYTYHLGSAASGLVIYEDKFAYSHHGTDPISGMLCNAYDLIRIHKFVEVKEDLNSTKSVGYMEQLILNDEGCKSTIAIEKVGKASMDFYSDPDEDYGDSFTDVVGIDTLQDFYSNDLDDLFDEPDDKEYEKPEDLEWMNELDADAKGNYLNSATNFSLVMRNDSRLKDAFKYNSFDNKIYIMKSVPWRSLKKPEPVRNVDYSGIRNYVERLYNISANQKLDDALNLEVERHRYHPITDYLKSLKWDGTKRIDTILHEYYGTEDNIYYSEALRKMMVGAVARVFRPGCKFDLVLTLVGEQGNGKSTFIKMLGKDWFSDTFYTVNGKDAYEQIQGSWIIEMAELAGLKKAEVEATKHFITKQEDIFRPAFMRTVETFKRQCVFFGTTNNIEFLKDATGNRRFMPVHVNRSKATKDVFTIEEPLIDALWAEAYYLYKNGEKLYLSDAADEIANGVRETHSEKDERLGVLERYLETPVPHDWDDMGVETRRFYLLNFDPKEVTETHYLRDKITSTEVWIECFSKDAKDINQIATRDFTNMMSCLKNWEKTNVQWRDKLYGKHRGFIRIK